MKKYLSRRKRLALAAVLSIASSGAFAAGGVADMVAAISFEDVIAAVFAIGVLVIGVDLAQLGYFKVRRLVVGAR